MRHLGFFGAALLALSACADSDSPLAPGDSPEGAATLATGALTGTILFSGRGVDGQGDLFTIHPDGTGLTHLTQLPGDELEPAWSWDNQWIVMVRPRPDGSNVNHFEPYIVDKTGNGGHWVTSAPLGIDLHVPAWSPDGSRIVASSNQAQLIAFDVAAGTAQTIPWKGGSPSFDPSGSQIIYSNGGMMFVVNATTYAQVRTIAAPSGTVPSFPGYSPDGKRIAFTAAGASSRDIWLCSANGSDPIRLVGGPTEDVRPAWSPDGLSIAYASTKRGQSEIWRTAVSGGKRTQVTTTVGSAPSWSH